MTPESRAELNRVSELAHQAVAEGLYETAIGCLDARGEPRFLAFTRGYWRRIAVSIEGE